MGVAVSRTGAQADLGAQYVQGLERWRDEVNAGGGLLGRRLELRLADDASRAAYAEILPDEKQESAAAFAKRALRWMRGQGVAVERIMTDNGAAYRSKLFARTCRELGIKHIFTKPYTPQTNGKAERFIQTALREWAYAQAYPTSQDRAATLPLWLHRYNWHRPHASLNAKPPITRLGLSKDNLLRLHT